MENSSKGSFQTKRTKVGVKILNYLSPHLSGSSSQIYELNKNNEKKGLSGIMRFIRSKFRRETGDCSSTEEVDDFDYYDMRPLHEHYQQLNKSEEMCLPINYQIRPTASSIPNRTPRYWYYTNM